MLTSANRSRTGRSVLEAAVGQPIGYFQDLWLASRLPPPQAEEADLILVRIDLGADQPVGPDLRQRPGPAEQGNLALPVAPPEVNAPPGRPLARLELPPRREGPPAGRRFGPGGPAPPQRLHVSQGPPLRRAQVLVLEARPDAGLPPAVVALDHGLEAHLG